MNVLLLVNELHDISFDRQVYELSKYLVRKNHDVFVFSLGRRGPLKAQFRKILGKRFFVSTGNVIADIRMIHRIIRQERIRILQTPALRSDLYGLAASRIGIHGRPVHIAVRHNYLFREPTLYHAVKNIAYVFSCHLVDMNVCVSGHITRKLAGRLYIPAARLHTIPNGVQVRKNPKKAAVLKKKLKIPGTRPVVLYAGAVIKRKNILFLLDALRRISGVYTAILAGDGPQKGEICRAVQTFGIGKYVHIEKFHDIAVLLGIADIVVLPSHDEGMPLILLEAMQSGIACIASDIDAHTELISHRVNGLIYARNNPDELASVLRQVIGSRNLRMRLGRNAREKAERLYTQKRMLDAYASLYTEINKFIRHRIT